MYLIGLYYLSTKDRVTQHYRCVFWMSVADLMGNIGYLFGIDAAGNKILCNTQAFFTQMCLGNLFFPLGFRPSLDSKELTDGKNKIFVFLLRERAVFGHVYLQLICCCRSNGL